MTTPAFVNALMDPAWRNGNAAVVRGFINAGAEVDVRDESIKAEGRTPLLYAAGNAHTALM